MKFCAETALNFTVSPIASPADRMALAAVLSCWTSLVMPSVIVFPAAPACWTRALAFATFCAGSGRASQSAWKTSRP